MRSWCWKKNNVWFAGESIISYIIMLRYVIFISISTRCLSLIFLQHEQAPQFTNYRYSYTRPRKDGYLSSGRRSHPGLNLEPPERSCVGEHTEPHRSGCVLTNWETIAMWFIYIASVSSFVTTTIQRCWVTIWRSSNAQLNKSWKCWKQISFYACY